MMPQNVISYQFNALPLSVQILPKCNVNASLIVVGLLCAGIDNNNTFSNVVSLKNNKYCHK